MKDKLTLKWLYKYSKSHILRIFLLTVLRSILSVLAVLFALSSRYVVDAATSGKLDALLKSAGVLLFIIIMQIVLRIIGQSLEITVTARLNMTIRGNLFSSILKRDFSAQSLYHSGDLLTRLSDDSNCIAQGIVSLVPSAISLFVGLIYAFYSIAKLDQTFALIFLLGGIILFLIIRLFKSLTKKLYKNIKETEGRTRSFFQEALSSLLMIKVFNAEDIISEKGNALQKENLKAVLKRRALSIFAFGGLGLIFSLGSFYALVRSAYRLYLGTISFGVLTAILQLVNEIQAPFFNLSGLLTSYYSILASSERIMEIENLPEDELTQNALEASSSYQGLDSIIFENVTFSYGRDTILQNASLTIKKGDFAAISGISGIGKSTLLKLLLGVFTPQSGSIKFIIDKKEIPAGKHSRTLFSYVPQGNLLMSGTIREAVSLVCPNVQEEDILNAAKISCALDFINALPQGLDTYIGEKGSGLSEGQIQRLAIMRAILSDAPIILLDEATSALDEETEAQLLENIKDLKNKTCIIISHKPAALSICSKHIFIEEKSIRTEEKA